MNILTSKYLSYLLIIVQISMLAFVNLTVPEINNLNVSIKYFILILFLISSIVWIFFYRFVTYICLRLCGIQDLKSKVYFNNIIYSSLIINTLQFFLSAKLSIDTSNFWLRIINPGNVLTLVMLALYLNFFESKKPKQISLFLGILILLNILSQILTSYMGVSK